MTTSAAGPVVEGEDEDDGPSRRVMFGVKLWPATVARYTELGRKRWPQANPRRVASPFARDVLLVLGETAYNAGYQPGDQIPRKRLSR